MLFNSLHFLVFFIVITTIYFLLPHKHRWKLLLLGSCYFYMTFVPVYILILGFTIIVDYFAGILIENAEGRKRKFYLILSLIANVGVLALFKYYNFLNDNLSLLLGNFHYQNPVPYLSILLPIGLSFHTFQAMSYTIEVYRGNQKPEKHFGLYALYVMFYPQLVAGPIERPQNILHQFREKHRFNYEDVTAGLKQMLWGFFKKVVVADRLSIFVDAIYNNPEKHSGISLTVATIFFAIQIYCDFSGYSDIALGTARVMGYKLMVNFRRPYLAKSIKEFWSRWHISLSTWFRDYLYIPLGGNRVSAPKWYLNIFIVFIVSGLWHGASWTFIVWGALHGLYQIIGLLKDKLASKLPILMKLNLGAVSSIYNIGTTFILTSFAWIFFRANSMNDAVTVIRGIFTWKSGGLFIGSVSTMFYAMVGVAVLFIAETGKEYLPKNFSLLDNNHKFIRHTTYACLLILILLIGVFNSSQFIYFQF